MLLMLDNYDSFTYNLVHYLDELGVEVLVKRNDAITVAQISALEPRHMIISPGPGRPEEAGVSMDAITAFSGKIPILGVCLGHQCIVQALGGRIEPAKRVMHGKTCALHHNRAGVFSGLPTPFRVTRYHSLVAQPDTLPKALEMTAWANMDDGSTEIMGVRHRQWALHGVQFHPESVMTEQGHALLSNFLRE